MVGRRADRLLEQGEQELLLPAEVLVEAAQRLARALDDLLDGELLARLVVVHQLEGGIEEALHAALGADPGGVERRGRPPGRASWPAAASAGGWFVAMGGTGYRPSARTIVYYEVEAILTRRRAAIYRSSDQTPGSTTWSIVAAPLSGTRGWRHTSTGNDTFTSE